jgi:iron complex outermembrane receptor protein
MLSFASASLRRLAKSALPLLLAAYSLLPLRAADEARKSFSVPAGAAAQTLKQFAQQAGREIVFAPEVVGNTQTQPVRGEFAPADALRTMLAGTGLVAGQDQRTGAFAVRKGESPNAPGAAPAASRRPAAPAVESDGITQLEAFTVTAIGQRFVNQDALQAKRAVAAVFDSISQDDIGKLPDVNIADSFRRIPGISAINDEDEGRFVLARGLQPALNHVTFEGMAIATHDAFGGGGRSVNLETIPASAVKRLEAFKTFTPAMDGGSIGSYLNLATRSASDQKGVVARAGASVGYFTQQDVPARSHPLTTRVQLSYGQTFGRDDQFGVFVAFEDMRKSRDQVKIIQDAYNFFNAAGVSTGTPLVGNGWAAPGQFRWYVYNNDSSRTGLNTKLEFNPSAAFRSYLSIYRFRTEDDEDRHGHQLISLAGMSGQTATSGSYANARSEVSFTHNDIRRKLDGAHYHAELTPAAGHRILADTAWSGTRYRNSTPFIGFRTPANPLLGLTYDSSEQIQTYRFTNPGGAAYFGDPASHVLDNYNYRELKTEEYLAHHKLAYAFNAKGERGPLGFEAGADWKRLDRRVNNDQWNYANPTFRLSQAARTLAYTPPARREPFLFLDDQAWSRLFAGGTGVGFTLTQPASFEASAQGDFKYLEDISAGYLMGTWQTSRFRAVGGLRYENVDATAKTFRRLVAPVPDVFIPIDVPTGYHNLLPSATASYELTDRVWMRAGISKSVGRPNPSDLAALESVSADGRSISRGNPNLKARDARNYDLSLEYYFPKGDGIASVAVFQKDIADDIFNLSTTETVNGTLITTTQPTNASSSRIRGLELALVRNHLPWVATLLPGLGFTGNLTLFDTAFNYVDARGLRYSGSRLPLQSKWSANAALAYEWKGRAEVRVAYDYRSQYTSTFNATQPWNSEGWGNYGQWDFNARWRATKRWHADFSIRNLGNAHRVHLRGLDLTKLHEDVDFGSSYWLGVTYRH